MKIKEKDIFDLEITDITDQGAGVAKASGMVVFVLGTVPGDRVKAEIIKVKKSHLVARVLEFYEKSPIRVENRCENRFCKSCAYKYLSYSEELSRKEENVRQIFKKAGLPEVEVLPIVGSPQEKGYRNKAQYPITRAKDGSYIIGFYAPKSHRAIEAADCYIEPEIFTEIIETLREFFSENDLSAYDEKTGKGLLRHIYLRRGEVTGEVLLTLVINGEKLKNSHILVKTITEKFPDVVGILLNINKKATNVILGERFVTLFGRDHIFDELSGVRLKITAPSFYQVNHDAAELLYAKAKELAAPEKTDLLLDLFCGAGSIGLSMAESCLELVGIEIVESAVLCARLNAESAGIQNASFYAGDATETERLLESAEAARGEKINPNIVILDPPRGGCDERLIKYVSALNPQRIVYISCNPATLARDMVIFRDLGFFAKNVTPFDLFPMTGHCETIVLLTKGGE